MKTKNQLLKCVIAASLLGQSFGANAEIDSNSPFGQTMNEKFGMMAAIATPVLLFGALTGPRARNIERLQDRLKMVQQDVVVKRYLHTRRLLAMLHNHKVKLDLNSAYFRGGNLAYPLEEAKNAYNSNYLELDNLKQELIELKKVKPDPSLFVTEKTTSDFLSKIQSLESDIARYEQANVDDLKKIASLERNVEKTRSAITSLEADIRKQQLRAVNALIKSKKGNSVFIGLNKEGKIINPKTGAELGEDFLDHLKSVDQYAQRRLSAVGKIQKHLEAVRGHKFGMKVFGFVAGVSGALYLLTLPEGTFSDLFSVESDIEREKILSDMSDQEITDVVRSMSPMGPR